MSLARPTDRIRPEVLRSSRLASIGFALSALSGAEAASAAVVTNTADSGPGSLRDAIAITNAGPDDTITFDPSLQGSEIVSSSQLTITDDLVMTGPGSSLLGISAPGQRALRVDDGSSASQIEAEISGMRIHDSRQGIHNREKLTLRDVTVENCRRTDTGWGGGIASYFGELSIYDSIVRSNEVVIESHGYGGGVGVYASDLSITRSTIDDNNAGGYGGGIAHFGSGTLRITDSIIRGNSAGDGAGLYVSSYGFVGAPGLIEIEGTTFHANSFSAIEAWTYGPDGTSMALRNVTISGNSGFGGISAGGTGFNLTITSSTITDNGSRGVYLRQGASANIQSSILAGNESSFGGPNDLYHAGAGSLTVSHSLVEVSNVALGPTNLTGIPAQLGPLQDNGGPTPTRALLPGSPALDSGSNPLALEFDQRGAPYFRTVGAQTDMGAFEASPGLYTVPMFGTFPLVPVSIVLVGAAALRRMWPTRG